MPEEQNEEQSAPRRYQQYIAEGGYFPPFPGFLAPGLYNFDLDARTATPVGESGLYWIENGDSAAGTSGLEVLPAPPPVVETIEEAVAPIAASNPPVSNGG